MFLKTNNLLKVLFFICFGLFLVNSALAIPAMITSTAEKKAYQDKLQILKDFVNSGIEYIRKNGAEKAYKEFDDPKGKFRKGDLYLFVYNYEGTNLAHGLDPKHMVGKNFFKFRDIYGTKVFTLIAKVAKLGGGFVHYYWPKPGSNDIAYKTAYIAPIDNNTFIGSGLYENIETPAVGLEVSVDELKAYVREAIEYYKINGEKAALAEFNNPQGKFNRGARYVFVLSNDGEILAHGADISLVGKPFLNARDEFGTPFVQMLIEAVKSGGGVVTYYWLNPEHHRIELKTSYVEPLTDHSFIGAGFYGI